MAPERAGSRARRSPWGVGSPAAAKRRRGMTRGPHGERRCSVARAGVASKASARSHPRASKSMRHRSRKKRLLLARGATKGAKPSAGPALTGSCSEKNNPASRTRHRQNEGALTRIHVPGRATCAVEDHHCTEKCRVSADASAALRAGAAVQPGQLRKAVAQGVSEHPVGEAEPPVALGRGRRVHTAVGAEPRDVLVRYDGQVGH